MGRMEEHESHLNMMFAELYGFTQQHLDEGAIIPATIAALVQVAKTKAKENEAIVGPDFFTECLQDILNGGEGLYVGKKYTGTD